MQAQKKEKSVPSGVPQGLEIKQGSSEQIGRTPAFIRAIECQAAAEGKTPQEVADVLGVTSGYLQQLKSGTRRTEHISREFAQAVALYCKAPPVAVLLMAGRVQIDDFFVTGESATKDLDEELNAIAQDEMLGALIPESAWAADESLKRFIVILFHEAKVTLIRNQRRLPLAMEDLHNAALLQEDFQALEALR